jgi:hypothetical protein
VVKVRVLRIILDVIGRKWREIREDCIMKSFKSCILRQSYKGGNIEDEMGGACNTQGNDDKCVQNFDRKTGTEYSADLGADGRQY